MNHRISFAMALCAALLSMPASADCSWEWLCSGEGACKHMPICDTVFEVPPPRPDSQPPAMPPTSMRPHKVPAAMGSLSCEHIMRKGKSGRWYWHEACFCSDPSKTRDPSAPFANIVRCDSR